MVDVPLVNEGTRPTVSVNDCLTVPAELVAENVIGKVPPVDGVPDNVAVPLAPARNVMPFGNDPDRVIVATGDAMVVTVNENGVPTSALAEAVLVNCAGCATVSVSCRVRIVDPLIAVTVSG